MPARRPLTGAGKPAPGEAPCPRLAPRASLTASSSRSALLRLGLPLAAVGLFAAACGSSGSASSGSTPPPTHTKAAAAASSSSSAKSVGLKLTGGHLTDSSGRTVYLWVADKGSKSTCTGQCATVWPPVPASGNPSVGSGLKSSLLGKTTRSDGSTQLLYAGHPLYYFEADTAPGAAKGQGSNSFGAKWWELTASGAAITGSAPSHSSTPPAHSSSSKSGGSGGGAYGY